MEITIKVSLINLFSDLHTYTHLSLCKNVYKWINSVFTKKVVDNLWSFIFLSTAYTQAICLCKNLTFNNLYKLFLSYTHIHSPYYYYYFNKLLKG